VVSGRLSNLTTGETLYIEVGGNGSNSGGTIDSPGLGGYNGGGTATIGGTFPPIYNAGGGGGGASDIRTAPESDGLSPDTRLIVAAGGGGGGHQVNSSTATGGNGGAGFNGTAVNGGNGAQGASGGGGGSGATAASGGAAGSAGSGVAGTAGTLGQGGNGGAGPYNNPAGGGGGGGGGLYGGGGGRGGTTSPTGGGGGGGGSSKVPAGGSISAAASGTNGSVEISYTIPGTDIDSGPSGPVSDSTPTLTFSSADSGATFECRIDSTDDADFAPCSSPFTPTSPLSDGPHTLDVRAVNGMGNFDPTPARVTFTVDTVPPTTTITSGPEGPTADTTPTFTYTAEPGSTFACAIDSDPLASCPASGFTAPPLSLAPHMFSVRATDAAGNVEATPATRSFRVIAPRHKCKKKKHKRAAEAKKKRCKKKRRK
jgi:hypothetical protein